MGDRSSANRGRLPRVYDHAWRVVREKILDRDGHVCQIEGPSCTVAATEVDHIIPVDAGGARLNPLNLRAACRACNAGRASTMKAQEGWRRAGTQITLVMGPPGAGKTTYVAERAGPSDLVVDYDQLAVALGAGSSHGADHLHDVTRAARAAVLRSLRRGEAGVGRAWIVSANPNAEQMFPHHDLVVVDPGREKVLEQVVSAERPVGWEALVDRWYDVRAGLAASASRDW